MLGAVPASHAKIRPVAGPFRAVISRGRSVRRRTQLPRQLGAAASTKHSPQHRIRGFRNALAFDLLGRSPMRGARKKMASATRQASTLDRCDAAYSTKIAHVMPPMRYRSRRPGMATPRALMRSIAALWDRQHRTRNMTWEVVQVATATPDTRSEVGTPIPIPTARYAQSAMPVYSSSAARARGLGSGEITRNMPMIATDNISEP